MLNIYTSLQIFDTEQHNVATLWTTSDVIATVSNSASAALVASILIPFFG